MSHFTHHSDHESTLRPMFLALGILVGYAVVSIYLENAVGLRDPLWKTVLAFACFLVFISPLIYLQIKAKIQERMIAPILVLCLAVLYTSALTTISVPIGRNLPDVDFHAAKALYCSTGHFFNDPITSFPSVYPPVYHIIVGSVMRLMGSSNSWYVLSRFHILTLVVLFLSVYLLANSLFNPRIGLLSVLLFCAVFDMPNQSGMFFPTPFILALTIMVNSLNLVYLGLQGKRWCFYPAGIITGLAVTMWPAFFPAAIALAAVIFFTEQNRAYRWGDLLRFILSFLVFPLLVWLPQYLLLSRNHLLGHYYFGKFRGLPGIIWFSDFFVRFIFLGGFDSRQHGVTILFALSYLVLMGAAILGFRSLDKKDPIKRRFLGLSLVLLWLFLPMVHYVFSEIYSRRFQILFSTGIAVAAAYYLTVQLKRPYKIWGLILLGWTAAFASGWNVYMAHQQAGERKYRFEAWDYYSDQAMEFIKSKTDFGEYIFATDKTYRYVIIGSILRFNLVAHRSGAYFSLNPDISDRLSNDYNAILNSNDFSYIRMLLGYYKIRYVLMQKSEEPSYPGLKEMSNNGELVYQNRIYQIYRCETFP